MAGRCRMYWRSVVLPSTDLDERVRLCVEDPGVRFEGRVVAQPLLVARACAGRKGKRVVSVEDFMMLIVSGMASN